MAHFTHTAPRLLHDRLAGWPRGSRSAASRSWISAQVRMETEASAEGLLKVWLCTYHSCDLTFIFYSNNNLRVHSVSAKTKWKKQKKKKTLWNEMSLPLCLLVHHVSVVLCCCWMLLCVQLLPAYCENEWSPRLKGSDWPWADAPCSGGLELHTQEDLSTVRRIK